MLVFSYFIKLLNNLSKISKLILTFSLVISGWTSTILFLKTTYSSEIKEVINKMYLNQKNFIFNVKDLSLLLVKDANKRFSDKDQETNQFRNEIKN